MNSIISIIAFLNWERNLAYDLGMTHGEMKDLVQQGIIKPLMELEEARQVLKERNVK